MIKIFNSNEEFNNYYPDGKVKSGNVAYVRGENADKIVFSTNNIDGEMKTYSGSTGGGGGEITLQEKSVTVNANGSQNVTPDDGYDGISKVALTVNVPEANLQEKAVTVNANGTQNVTPDEGYDGISKVALTVNVATDNTVIDLDALGFPLSKAPQFGDANSGTTNLTYINLSNSVKQLPDNFVRNCTNITGIGNMSHLTGGTSNFAFNNSGIEELVFPNTVTSYGQDLCSNCSSLHRVVLSSGATEIGRNMFTNCTALSELIIPEGVERTYDSSCFSGCSGLTNITLPSTMKSVGFKNANFIANVNLPEGLTEIQSGAFSKNSVLALVDIPSTVTTIGYDAFWFNEEEQCTIICRAAIPPTFAGGNRVYAKALYVPDDSVDAYKAATNWNRLEAKIYPLSDYPTE